jgi:two-component system, LuxR family, sensor kinase FixL
VLVAEGLRSGRTHSLSWLIPTWLIVASACLTLAAIHALVWFRQRDAKANGAFAVLAVSVAAFAYLEVRMLHADTPAEFGRMAWWYQFPVWSALVAVVGFVRFYLKAGRPWLGWTAVLLRTLALAINFFSTPSINFREITSLEKVTVFGDSLSLVQGVPNPWMAIGQLSLAALVLFVADAALTVWRRGERRQALTIGGSLVAFVTAGTVVAILSYWGLVRLPVFVTPFFLPIVLAMAYELSRDLLRAVHLSAALDAKEAELRGSDEKLTLAADAASAGLWSVDTGTGRLWATARALSMFGLATDREHHVDEVLRSVHPEDRERVRALVHGPQPADRLASIEYRVVGADGDTRWYASLGRADGAVPGRPTRRMGATIDVTERKRAEDETARQRVELEHLSRVATLSELSGALAHELNQPLAIIMSNAEAAQRLLERAQPDLDEIRAILGDIVREDERAGEVIRRLRGLLKRGTPNRQPLSLNQLVESVLKFMRADLIRRGVAVEVALDPDLPLVQADRVPIEQVLINVIGNACDAMAANEPGDRRLRIATGADAGSVQVTVFDVGTGLPSSPDRVFDAFFTTKPEGLGMGLAISRSIVAAHGGRLWAEPNGDRGAAFHVGLPRTAEAP